MPRRFQTSVSTQRVGERFTPDEYAERISAPTYCSSDRARWPSAFIRYWKGTSPDMSQPALDHHYVVMHLGGAKRVERRCSGPSVVATVEHGALTIGPIEFAHLYLRPTFLEEIAFRLDSKRDWTLKDPVGVRDPLLEALFGRLLQGVQRPPAGGALFLDCLLDSFAMRLLSEQSTAKVRTARGRETLTAFRIARIAEYVDSHLEQDIQLADLVSVAGVSRPLAQ